MTVDQRRCPEGRELFGGSQDVADAPIEPSARFPLEVDHPVAVPLGLLEDRRVVDVQLAGRPPSVWWAPGATSALDAPPKTTVVGADDTGG